ncbi:MAG TPA: FAD-dependent oxidoreductase [Thermoleophilaceae bacterium]|nr:FAD-dependent oxidoreductase [Thermoleophilaceae bacterium]
MRTVPYWLDYPYEPRRPLEGEASAEVCVIGGGVSGLSCARELAQRGVDTVVLEARTVGSGASGRNGGFLLAGGAPFHVDARERFGRDAARRLYARTVAAQDEVVALASQLGVADAVRRVGSLRLAVSEQEAEHVRRHVEALREDGFAAELVERDELEPLLRGIGHAGCLVEHDAALQPARWIRALARDAERAGARIYENTRGEPGKPVKTAHTVIAGDAASAALVPSVRARRLHMIATAPIARSVVSTLVYARYGYEYFQQTPDGRIALGGFSDLDGESSYTDREDGNPAVWERLGRYLHEELGLGDAEVTHRWVGVVGFSEGDRPFAGAVEEGLYTLGGYSGTGNLIGFIAGRAVAELIATGESDDLRLLASL